MTCSPARKQSPPWNRSTSGGYDTEQILHGYPELSRDDVVTALDYASAVVDEEKVVALGA